ncbi:MAG: GTP-binding protein [Ginsengibacter sp.]
MHIKKAEYLISSPDYSKCPVPDRPEYAFIGRSNVGKSSLINMLCDNDKLAKTSNSPGKTQMINHFMIESTSQVSSPAGEPARMIRSHGARSGLWYLVDLPGYGFAKISLSSRRRWEQMIEHYLRKRENLMQVFLLIDARHSPQKADIAFLSQLKKWDVPFSLVFTKADKETQAIVSKNVKLFLEEMRKTWQFLPRNFVTSAVKKSGKDKILTLIEELNNAPGMDN